jgi:thiol-disulfide isomerase/thioredoxin
VQQRELEVREHLGGEPCGFLLRRLDLEAVLLVDRRAHDECLPAGLDLLTHELVGLPPFGGGPRDPRRDRLPARGHLVEHRDVQVAVIRHGERSRDRRGRHDQHVRRRALLLQRDALMEAEAVLLVDHGERQIGEVDAILDERVRSDEDVHLPGRHRLEDPFAFLAGDGRREQREDRPARLRLIPLQQRGLRRVSRGSSGTRDPAPSNPGQHRLHAEQVLTGQHLGGRHDRGLMPGLHRNHARLQGDGRLPRADIPLQQPVHRTRSRHVVADLRDRAALRRGELERQALHEALGQVAGQVVGDALGPGFDAMLAHRDAELEEVQLVELEPFARLRLVPIPVGEVDLPNRSRQIREILPAPYRGRDGIGELAEPAERVVHEPSDDARRDSLGGGVHRDDPTRVDLVGLAALEHLHGGLLDTEAPAKGVDLAGDRDLLALLVPASGPRLVEPGQVDHTRPVVHAHRDDRSPVRQAARRDLLHRADERRLRLRLQIPDLGDARPVDVRPRVVVQEIRHGLDPDPPQGLGVPLGPPTDGEHRVVESERRHQGIVTSGVVPAVPYDRQMRRLLALLTASVLLAACGSGGEPVAEATLPTDPHELPEYDLERYRMLVETLEGTPIVVNFWGSWCPPCEDEAPHLATVSKEYEGEVQFLGIDIVDAREPAREFIRRYGWTYPSLFDPTAAIRDGLGYVGQPITLIYDRLGELVWDKTGTIDAGELREQIENVL